MLTSISLFKVLILFNFLKVNYVNINTRSHVINLYFKLKNHCMEAQQNQPEKPQEKAIDRAGIGQTDEEKGIAPEEVRKQKRKELEEQGGVKKKPTYRAEDDEPPLQIDA